MTEDRSPITRSEFKDVIKKTSLAETTGTQQAGALKEEPTFRSTFNFPGASFNAPASFRHEVHSYSVHREFPLLEQLKKGNATWGPNGQLPSQNINFIGRKDLLEGLQLALEQSKRVVQDKPSAVIVYAGLGGVGKTELVLNYMLNTRNTYSLRAWFKAENPIVLQNAYLELAQALGYISDTPNLSSVLTHIKQQLARYPGWLLVYDNAIHFKEIEPFLPAGQGCASLLLDNAIGLRFIKGWMLKKWKNMMQ